MKRILDLAEQVIKVILNSIVIVFTIVVILQIVSRYIFNSPFTWTEQLARYLFFWMILLGVPVVYRHKGYVAFDLLLHSFPHTVRNLLELIFTILILVFAVLYFKSGFELCVASSGRMTSGLKISSAFLNSIQPICAALIFIYGLEALISQIKELFGKYPAGGD